ncbi:hypothetical protein RE6C_02565 [Rhodopirellula europaea 6C]|uniref:Uncharacterized protein n=1 Tax=Rhodopirellula europaea 6C TaxID=1263867 RepID=M2AHY3_9BACT|nr:hypothetical protein RE6C_02565 [Rhodopirellula europaea 6C]
MRSKRRAAIRFNFDGTKKDRVGMTRPFHSLINGSEQIAWL